jgi:hypothetical protein
MNGGQRGSSVSSVAYILYMLQHAGAKLENRSPLSLKPVTCVDSRLSVPDSEIHNYRWKNIKANHADRGFSTVLPVCIRASETCRVQIHANTTVMVTALSTLPSYEESLK